LRAGFDLSNDSTKLKFYVNLQNFLIEDSFTYLISPRHVVGANLVFDPKTSKLTKYDFGVNNEIAPGSNFGIKHESTSKEAF
jgi:hypothetical protein